MKLRSAIALLMIAGVMALSPATDIALQVWRQQEAKNHAAMPCCARLTKGDTCHSEPSAPQAPGHCSRHSDKEHGQCSSLCHCQCCQHIISVLWADLPMLGECLAQSMQPLWHNQYHFDYTDLIWQPPRLS